MRRYGWTLEYVMDMPVDRIWALMTLINAKAGALEGPNYTEMEIIKALTGQ